MESSTEAKEIWSLRRSPGIRSVALGRPRRANPSWLALAVLGGSVLGGVLSLSVVGFSGLAVVRQSPELSAEKERSLNSR